MGSGQPGAAVRMGCVECKEGAGDAQLLALLNPAMHLKSLLLVPRTPGKGTAWAGKRSHSQGKWEWFRLWDQGRANVCMGRGYRYRC